MILHDFERGLTEFDSWELESCVLGGIAPTRATAFYSFSEYEHGLAFLGAR